MKRDAVLVYHDPCMDGFSAAMAGLIGISRDPRSEFMGIILAPMKYGQKISDVVQLDSSIGHVYFLDICPDVKDLLSFADECLNKRVSITVIDHHKTAIDAVSNLLNSGFKLRSVKNLSFILDPNKSGALLSFEHFCIHEGVDRDLSSFFRLVSDRDLLKETHEASCLHAYLSCKETDASLWESIIYNFNESRREIIAAGAAILERDLQLTEEIASKSTLINLDGYLVPLSFSPKSFASQVGNLLAKNHSNLPFAAVVELNRPEVSVSLRSTGFDVELIARKFGGGGHLKAAGFRVETRKFLSDLASGCINLPNKSANSGGDRE